MLFTIICIILIYKLFLFSNYYINNKERINKKYNDFNILKANVKFYHPEYNKIKLFIETSKLVIKKYKEEYLQNKFGIIKHVNNNLHVKYYKNYKPYIIILKHSNNKKIFQINIYDENDNDITEKIKPYMGFNYDFHGLNITPNDLGYNKLTFIINKIEHVFNSNDKINIHSNIKHYEEINKDTINQ